MTPRRHARAEAARKAWLAAARQWPDGPWPCGDAAEVADRLNDSHTAGYTPKLPADDPRYRDAVAVPTMQAVDSLPVAYRALVHEFGYVDVYRAWKRGWAPARIAEYAERCGGVFSL